MKKGALLFLLALFIPFVSGQASYCFVATNCSNVSLQPDPSLSYGIYGYLSSQGHYSEVETDTGISYSYRLCCPDAFIKDTGGASFLYSPTNIPGFNGSGHVQEVGAGTFPEDVLLGAACTFRDSCLADETCVFNVSNTNGSHAMDCYRTDTPSTNTYTKSMCCKLTEICYDGIDNDLDGFIDCADGDCNDYTPTTFGDNPELCTNFLVDPAVSSPYNSSTCIIGYNNVTGQTIYNPNCTGQYPPPNNFYCGFGRYDDPTIEPTGVCCPVGERPVQIAGTWQCGPTAECGLAPRPCVYDFDLSSPFTSPPDWLSSVYSGDINDWCNTQVTNLLYPLEDIPPGYEGSTGCCLIPKYGQINYWLDEDNVRIWG